MHVQRLCMAAMFLALTDIADAAAAPLALQTGSQVTSLQVTFMGVDRDVVGRGGDARSDGTLDGHFRVQASFNAWPEVAYIAVYNSNASGYPTGGPMWHTQQAGYPVLGVLYNDLLLNATHVPRLGKFNGALTLDLYASDLGAFTPGNLFMVQIGLRGTESVGSIVQVTGAGGPGVTTPAPPPAGPMPPPRANSPPNPPVIAGPPNTYQPALPVGGGINLSWQNRGDPDNDPVSFYVNVFRTYWDYASGGWTAWALVFEGSVQGTSFTLGPQNGLVANACYAWRVFSVDQSYRSNPYYASSDWSVFCGAQ